MVDDAKSREPQLMRELLEAQIETRVAKITTRLDAMDHALRLAQEFPTAIDKAIGHLRELHGERFDALERRVEEQRRAEEKARDKAEESIVAHLQQLERTHESRNETMRTMLAGLEKRLTLIEGERSGASANWGWIIGIIGLLIAALAVGASPPW